MGKRKTPAESITAAFGKAQKAAAAPRLPPLETACSLSVVPEQVAGDVGEVMQQYSQYCEHEKTWQSTLEQAAKQRSNRDGQAANTAAADPTGAASPEDCRDDARKAQDIGALWQGSAAYINRQLSLWAGSSTMLPMHLQQCLLHIALNQELHPDPLISVKAYQLLWVNLQRHPPAVPAAMAERQPPVLQTFEELWHPLHPKQTQRSKLTAKLGGTGFGAFQDLVSNAVLLVTGSSSGINSSSSNSSAPSQGKALVLLYLVQLLHSDCVARLAAFEQHMQLCQGPTQEQKALRQRALVLLQNSYLFRVMEADLSWKQSEGIPRGKAQVVRDLVQLVASGSDEKPAAAAAAIAALAVGQTSGIEGSTSTATDQQEGSAAAQVQPVSGSELSAAARRLLLLMLHLYSNCEAAGLYGGNASMTHHTARGAAARENDRYCIDDVIRQAVSGSSALQSLRADAAGVNAAAAALHRVLQCLPPAHRVRLVALVVAEAIGKRVNDPGPESSHIASLEEYRTDEGKACDTGFRRGDALEVIKALGERIEWASRDVLGGKESFALMVASLISAAIAGRQLPQHERQEFAEVGRRVLDFTVQANKARLTEACAKGNGHSDVSLALAGALRQLPVA